MSNVLSCLLTLTATCRRSPYRKVVLMLPGGSHTQECHMGDSLGICCDPVMLLVRQVSNLTLKAAQDPLHQCQSLGSTPMVDDDQRLSFRGDSRSVHRVTGDDVDIFGQVLLERRNLWCLNRCLARHNRSNLCRY